MMMVAVVMVVVVVLVRRRAGSIILPMAVLAMHPNAVSQLLLQYPHCHFLCSDLDGPQPSQLYG